MLTLKEVIDELRVMGVQCANNQKLMFKELDYAYNERSVHAYGLTKNTKKHPSPERRVAVCYYTAPDIDHNGIVLTQPVDVIIIVGIQLPYWCNFNHRNGVDILKVHIGEDLLYMDDLKKGDPINEGFWLMGDINVEIERKKDECQIVMGGMTVYDVPRGQMVRYNSSVIAQWFVDPDYDGEVFKPAQMFFPTQRGVKDIDDMAKRLKKHIDASKMDAFKGTVSLPFRAGRKIGVKAIDQRGMEYIRVFDP